MEHKAGDLCADCQQLGLERRLRHFQINRQEQILKCESSACLYPHQDEICSDDDDDEQIVEPHKSTVSANDARDALIADLLSDCNSIPPAPDEQPAIDFWIHIPSLDGDDQRAAIIPPSANAFAAAYIKQESKLPSPQMTQIKDELKVKKEATVKHESTATTSAAGMQPTNEANTNAEEDIPKARISRCFNTMKMVTPKSRTSSKPCRRAKPRQHVGIMQEPGAAAAETPTTSGMTTLDVLKLMQRTKTKK